MQFIGSMLLTNPPEDYNKIIKTNSSKEPVKLCKSGKYIKLVDYSLEKSPSSAEFKSSIPNSGSVNDKLFFKEQLSSNETQFMETSVETNNPK